MGRTLFTSVILHIMIKYLFTPTVLNSNKVFIVQLVDFMAWWHLCKNDPTGVHFLYLANSWPHTLHSMLKQVTALSSNY